MVAYVMYAERWGWTPRQVDELTLEQEDWLMPIGLALDAEKAYREKKAEEKAKREAKANQSRG